MSHDGPPPPGPDEGQPPEQQPEQQPGAHAGPPPSEPRVYNPYPDNWDTASTGNPAFNVTAPPPTGSPYGQPNPYGAPAHAGGPANPYAGPVGDKPTFGFGGYAGWFTRVGAYLIDSILTSIAGAPLWVGEVMRFRDLHFVHRADGTLTTQTSGTSAGAGLLILIGAVTGLAFLIWNAGVRQGRTGASIGKSVLAIRLVNSELQPIGPGRALLRQLLHILDGLPCACLPLGYLWPIWDSQKQTFADKIMGSYVIQSTAVQERPFR